MYVTRDTIGCITSRAIKKNAAASGKEGLSTKEGKKLQHAAVEGKIGGRGNGGGVARKPVRRLVLA